MTLDRLPADPTEAAVADGASPVADAAVPAWPARFDLEAFFRGRVRATGLFQDRFGRVVSEFDCAMIGRDEGGRLVIDEDFRFRDGKRSRRQWRIRRLAEGVYDGAAADFVGPARGTVAGNVMRWRYVLKLPIGQRTVALRFDDRSILQPDGALLNVADASKFGVRLARLVCVMRRD
jgi:hypothetical protein